MSIKYLFTFLLVFVCLPVYAFDARIETVPVQYEVISINDPEVKQLILGELDNSPEMFEIVSEEAFTLAAEIRAVQAKNEKISPEFGVIIIRQKEVRGVEEVARLDAKSTTWPEEVDGPTGLRYLVGPYFNERLEAGTYRIEISNPNNLGKYMLLVGTKKDDASYGESLSSIKKVYEFYGLGTLSMLKSPFVHYPVGIVILIGLIAGTWYWQRKQKSHA